MRLLSEHYACANPYWEPVSLDRLTAIVDDEGDSLITQIPDDSLTPEQTLLAGQVHAAVATFVEGLGQRDRTIVTRIFWHGESQADVARALGISGAAVTKRLQKILAQGREALAFLRRSIVVH